MPKPSQRRRRIALWAVWCAVGALAIGLLITVTIAVLRLGDDNDRLAEKVAASQADRTDLRHLVEQQGTALDDANRRLVELGAEPVAPPPAALPSSPLQGPRGFPGPQGPRGPKGDRGNAGADGNAGSAGATGQAGSNGEAGAKGDQGPAGPQGDRGPEGPAGPQGPPGTALPGTYSCPDGEYLRGFTVAPDGSVNLICAPVAQLPTGGNP